MSEPPAIVHNATTAVQLYESAGGLRIAEKVTLGFFAYATTAGFVFPLSFRERALMVGLNLLAGTAVVLLARLGGEKSSKLLTTLRDWSPAVLILLAYRESGLFLTPDPTHRLDYLFIQWDRVLLENPLVLRGLSFFSPWLQRYLEFAYFLCYPLVPIAAGSLLLARRAHRGEDSHAVAAVGACPPGRDRQEDSPLSQGDLHDRPGASTGLAPGNAGRMIDHFWTAVLLAVLTCYVLFPFFPLTPPRVLFHDVPSPVVLPVLRRWNYWLLDRYSVQACIFPSGHVAAVTAVALAIRAYLPRVGVLFIIAAASIAVSTVYGRYHYAADALAGALVGLAAYFISTRIHR